MSEVTVLGRSRWGAAPPRWNPGAVSPSRGVFVHYNGPQVSPAVLAGDFDSVASFLRSIQAFHMGPQRNWPDIAYSFCVDSVGRIWELRGWGVAQAATLNHNWSSHSIFLPLGGNQSPTAEQIAACLSLVLAHDRRYGRGFVKGHQQAPNQTSCPGPVVMARINAGDFNPYRNPTPDPLPPPPAGGDNMATPIMMRAPTGRIEIYYRFEKALIHVHPNGSRWLVYPGTPFRVEIRSEQDFNALRFMGVPVQELNQGTAEFFWRYSVRQAPPRMHVLTPRDVEMFRFMGVPQQEVTREQAAFFNRFSTPFTPQNR